MLFQKPPQNHILTISATMCVTPTSKKTKRMKINLLLCICSFCILSTAYSQKVLSLHPLFTEQDAVLIPEIEGLWSIPDFDMTVSFQKAGDNFYLLKYGS